MWLLETVNCFRSAFKIEDTHYHVQRTVQLSHADVCARECDSQLISALLVEFFYKVAIKRSISLQLTLFIMTGELIKTYCISHTFTRFTLEKCESSDGSKRSRIIRQFKIENEIRNKFHQFHCFFLRQFYRLTKSDDWYNKSMNKRPSFGMEKNFKSKQTAFV